MHLDLPVNDKVPSALPSPFAKFTILWKDRYYLFMNESR